MTEKKKHVSLHRNQKQDRNMAHSHSHTHGHSHHIHAAQSLSTVFILCIALNLLFVITEASVGFACNSLGLLSDAGLKVIVAEPPADVEQGIL